MRNPFDDYFLGQPEPTQSCLLTLRKLILASDKDVTTAWKYGMPFFSYQGKMFCYLWVHRKHNLPYIGFVEGTRLSDPDLLEEKRARMKILLVDPKKDIPIRKVGRILKEALSLYKSGIVKVPGKKTSTRK